MFPKSPFFAALFVVAVGCTADNPDLVVPEGDPGADLRGAASVASADGGADAMPGAPDARTMFCVPGATVSCGRCGTAITMCVDDQAVEGVCEGEGACSPSDVEDSADKCSARACDGDCQWGAFHRKPTSDCAPGETRSCVTNPATCSHAGTQRCNNCRWTACACD